VGNCGAGVGEGAQICGGWAHRPLENVQGCRHAVAETESVQVKQVEVEEAGH